MKNLENMQKRKYGKLQFCLDIRTKCGNIADEMNLKCDDLRSTNFQIRGALDGIEQIKAVTETGFFHSSQSLSSNYDGAVLVSLLSTLNRS